MFYTQTSIQCHRKHKLIVSCYKTSESAVTSYVITARDKTCHMAGSSVKSFKSLTADDKMQYKCTMTITTICKR